MTASISYCTRNGLTLSLSLRGGLTINQTASSTRISIIYWQSMTAESYPAVIFSYGFILTQWSLYYSSKAFRGLTLTLHWSTYCLADCTSRCRLNIKLLCATSLDLRENWNLSWCRSVEFGPKCVLQSTKLFVFFLLAPRSYSYNNFPRRICKLLMLGSFLLLSLCTCDYISLYSY